MEKLPDIQAQTHTCCDFDDLATRLGSRLSASQGKPFLRDIILVDGRAQSNWLTRALLERGGMDVHMNADLMTTRRFASWVVSAASDLPKGSPMPLDAAPALIFNLISPSSPFASDWAQYNGQAELGRLEGATETERVEAQVRAEMVRWGLSYRLNRHFRELLRNDPDWITKAQDEPDAPTRWMRLWHALYGQARLEVADAPVHEVDVKNALEQDDGNGKCRRHIVSRLPGRITLVTFGDIPRTTLRILAELSRGNGPNKVDVAFFHFVPTPDFIADMGEDGRLAKLGKLGVADSGFPSTPGYQFLDYAGKHFRIQQDKLDKLLPNFGAADGVNLPEFPETMLGDLQKSICDYHVKPEPRADSALETDASITVHRCHGPRREVEVLRDELLRAFRDKEGSDNELLQGDVLILSPNPELYMPLLESVLSGRTPRIRFRTAAMYGARNSAFGALTKALLDLPAGRVTASEVLSLLSMRALQAKHGWNTDDVGRVRRWISDAPFFWGIDTEHRKQRVSSAAPDSSGTDGKDAPAVSKVGTLDDFMQRLAVGTATGRRLFVVHSGEADKELLPLLGIEGADDLRLAFELRACLKPILSWARAAQSPASLDEWVRRFNAAAMELLPKEEPYLREYRELGDALKLVERDALKLAGGSADAISYALFSEILLGRCEFAAGAGQFLSGDATLAPLRASSVHPSRIIAMLGMNDGAFPIQARNLGPEVALSSESGGLDEDKEAFSYRELRASEDTSVHAFLLALSAAKERLIITFDGYIPGNGKPASPAAPVHMLVGVARTIRAGFDIQSHGLMEYQIPPKDVGGGAGPKPDKPCEDTTDPVAFEVATALGGEKVNSVLEPKARKPISALEDGNWLAFWANPAASALYDLGVAVPARLYELEDAEPLEYKPKLVKGALRFMEEHGISVPQPVQQDVAGVSELGSSHVKKAEDSLRRLLELRGILPHANAEGDKVFDQVKKLGAIVFGDHTSLIRNHMGLELDKNIKADSPQPQATRSRSRRTTAARTSRVRAYKPRTKLQLLPFTDDNGAPCFWYPDEVDSSGEVELAALAYMLRKCEPHLAGKSGAIFDQAHIYAMPEVKEDMAPALLHIKLEIAPDKPPEQRREIALRMRRKLLLRADKTMSSRWPVIGALLGKSLWVRMDKVSGKKPTPPGKVEFEQKDLLGKHGIAKDGPDRFMLPENLDLGCISKLMENLFPAGAVRRTSMRVNFAEAKQETATADQDEAP